MTFYVLSFPQWGAGLSASIRVGGGGGVESLVRNMNGSNANESNLVEVQ